MPANSSVSGLKTVTDSGGMPTPARRGRIAYENRLTSLVVLARRVFVDDFKIGGELWISGNICAETRSSEPLPRPRSTASVSVNGSPTGRKSWGWPRRKPCTGRPRRRMSPAAGRDLANFDLDGRGDGDNPPAAVIAAFDAVHKMSL